MENPQMGMPAEMAPQGPGPEEMAIFDQMRQEISPQEFSNEMLAGASQVDPQAVAEFTQELQGLDMPPEALDALNDVVDEILASPERYPELRAQYMEQGLPEDILPEQFDPQFFAALNMAIDQMIAAPTGVQAFAEGGIAELKPIAKAIASYGRNGDTMLAHITPAEARMLRRRGGSGTINPKTGLPEFFLKGLFKGIGKALKSIGNAVKKFANSTVGRLVTTVALGFFLGPAAASFMGVSSVAGVAAVSGFVGSAGSTLLGGGNLKDALKAGAIGGLTAGAGAGVMGGSGAFASGSYAGPTTIGGQFDAFKSATGIGAAPVVDAPAAVPGLNQSGMAPVPGADVTVGGPMVDSPNLSQTGQNLFDSPASEFTPKKVDITNTGNIQQVSTPGGTVTQSGPPVDVTEFQGSLAKNAGTGQPPSLVDQAKDFYSKNISPSGIQEAGREGAMSKTLAQYPSATEAQIMNAPANSVLGKAYAANMPGLLSTYGPMAAVGLGTMAAFGGFESKPVNTGPITQSLMKPVTQRIAEEGTQRQMYMQGLPGVEYDQFGAPIPGGYSRLPTYDVPDYNSGGYGSYGSGGQGIMDVPTVYNSPAGSIGSRRVAQPYNNSDMYSNLVPRRAADGGYIQHFEEGGDASTFVTDTANAVINKVNAKTPEEIAADAAKAAADAQALKDSQAANRARVAQQKAMKKAQGSGSMYANINAGLSALAPENFPGAPVTLSAERSAAMTDAFKGAKTDADYARTMQANGYRPEEVAALTGIGYGDINRRYNTALRQNAYAPALQGQRDAMSQQAGIAANSKPNTEPPRSAADTARANQFTAEVLGGAQKLNAAKGQPTDTTGGMYSNITNPGPGYTGPNLYSQTLSAGLMPTGDDKRAAYQRLVQQGATDPQIRNAAETMFGPQSAADWKGISGFNTGGIAGLAAGGYPRRNGQISGPGTEKSDSIPAMLSDGEFVMTAKAVRGAGKGSRRAGAKQMYKLMHQLEKNSERG